LVWHGRVTADFLTSPTESCLSPNHPQRTFDTPSAAAYVGGPQAGQAVLSLASSANDASNGDYAGASRKLVAGVNGAIKGVETYNATGGRL
jgi:hypothetical protein